MMLSYIPNKHSPCSATSMSVQTIYNHPNATYNLRSVLNVGNITLVGGSNYLMILDRSSKGIQTKALPARPGIVPLCHAFRQPHQPKEICSNAITLITKVNASTALACGTDVESPVCYFVDLQARCKKMRKAKDDEGEIEIFEESDDNDVDGDYVDAAGDEAINSDQNEDSYAVSDASFDVDRLMSGDIFATNPAIVLYGQTASPEMYVGSCSFTGLCYLQRRINNERRTKVSRSDFSGINPGALFSGIYPYRSGQNQYIYVFYRDRETAFVNDGFTVNGANNEYGMVGRVCERDIGGTYDFHTEFITFVNARLLCPYPGGSTTGSANTYYNVLGPTIRLGNVVYGLFTFPNAWGVAASAVCAYDLATVDSIMNGSTFPNQRLIYYNPNKRNFGDSFSYRNGFSPGQCPPPNRTTRNNTSEFRYFVRTSSLLRKTINPLNNVPSYVATTRKYQFMAATAVGPYHVLYLLTESSRLTKVRLSSSDSTNKLMLYEVQLNNVDGKINSLSLAGQDLIVVTLTQVIKVSPSNCSIYDSCESCEADPHCNWIRENYSLRCVLDLANTFIVDTCPTAPSSPGSVTVSTLPSSLSISWGSASGNLSSYIIEVTRNSDGLTVYENMVNPSTLQVETPNIPIGAQYSVSVKAVNERIASKASVKNFTAGLEQPSITVQTIRDTSCQFIWKEIPGASKYNFSLYSSVPTRLVKSYLIMPAPSTPDQFLSVNSLEPGKDYNTMFYGISPYGINSAVASLPFTTTVSTTTTREPSTVATSFNFKTTIPTDYEVVTTSHDSEFSTVELNTKPSLDDTSSENNTELQADMSTISVPTRPNSLKSNQSTTKNNIGSKDAQLNLGSTSGLTVVVIIFLILLLFLVGVFIQNRHSMGVNTKKITIGDDNVTVKRRAFLFWIRQKENGYIPGEAS